MKSINKYLAVLFLFLGIGFTSCEDYLDIDAPDSKIVSETVFNDDVTATGAMQGIYNQLATVPFSNGGPSSITVLGSLSSDVLEPIRTSNFPYVQIDSHEILPENPRVYDFWSSAYNIIYMTNSLLEGLENSSGVSEGLKERLMGEAFFVRAFAYFYLVNFYGDIPLILSTDYDKNTLAERTATSLVYDQILLDLSAAKDLLVSGSSTDRYRINLNTLTAFSARVHLYLENWQQAEILSSEIINNDSYQLKDDLNEVFLINSQEAIWQLSPLNRGGNLTNTLEGSSFIIHPFLSFLAQLKLKSSFVDTFGEDDLRLQYWISKHFSTGNYYPHKYKVFNSTDSPTEASMVMRFAEQYLIRAEARLMQGDIAGSIADINVIKIRAGLEELEESVWSQEELIDIILIERKKELFTEWGHRWLDLKRLDRAESVFSDESTWENTDVLFPIPEADRLKNPNLSQNPGY